MVHLLSVSLCTCCFVLHSTQLLQQTAAVLGLSRTIVQCACTICYCGVHRLTPDGRLACIAHEEVHTHVRKFILEFVNKSMNKPMNKPMNKSCKRIYPLKRVRLAPAAVYSYNCTQLRVMYSIVITFVHTRPYNILNNCVAVNCR